MSLIQPWIARQGDAPLDGLGPEALPPAGQQPLHAQAQQGGPAKVQEGGEGREGPPEGRQGQFHGVAREAPLEGDAEVGHIEAPIQDAGPDPLHGGPVLALAPGSLQAQRGGAPGKGGGFPDPPVGRVWGLVCPGPQLRQVFLDMQGLWDGHPVLSQGSGRQRLPGQGGLVAGQLEGGRAEPGTGCLAQGRLQGGPWGQRQQLLSQTGDPGLTVPGGDQGRPGQGQQALLGVAGLEPGAPLGQEVPDAGGPGARELEGPAMPGAEIRKGHDPIGTRLYPNRLVWKKWLLTNQHGVTNNDQKRPFSFFQIGSRLPFRRNSHAFSGYQLPDRQRFCW